LNREAFRRLRLVVAVALASGLVWVICRSLGLGSATPYGVVVAALFIRPAFDRWPPPVFLLLPLVVTIGLSLGTALKPLLEAPQVWQFAVVTVIAQIIGQALPDKLMMLRNLLAVLAVLPLLGSNATWLGAWQQSLAVLVGMVTATLLQAGLRLPQDEPAEAVAARAHGAPPPEAAQEGAQEVELPSRSLVERFADPYFWRKLVVAALALSIGLGVGAATPKYLYFGVVLLLNDSLGATITRVRDRMLGVSLGVLMPALVFNTMEISSVAVALVMGGTTALMLLLRLDAHLRTALISSGVTFVGYGALTQWYIPNRWLDYLMGCALALLVCLLVRPLSALGRFQALAREAEGLDAGMRALLPSALEEARLLGQQRQFQQLVQRLESGVSP
jgi:uncharacterized membrane protein YgaE (UPF0421/DUF939 family)